MKPRERVLKALRHEEPDRVPLDLGATIDTGIYFVAYKKLLSFLNKGHLILEEEDQRFMDLATGIVEIDEEIAEEFEVDVRGVVPGRSPSIKGKLKKQGEYDVLTDTLGAEWFRPKGGYYFDQKEEHCPLRNVSSVAEIDAYAWPSTIDPQVVEKLREKIIPLRERFAIAVGDPVGGIFASGFRMRGYRNFFVDLARNPSLACGLMDRITDMKIAYWEVILETLGDVVDILVYEDDLGQQDRPLISPEMYRALVKPRHRRLLSFLRKKIHGEKYVFIHTDGSVYALIPDLIEVGFDILNPVQVSAVDMDSKKLKREFGRDIAFWGGGVDTQGVLSFGTEAEVREEVKKRIDDLAPGGGFIFSTIHNIQPEVPPENIMAMLDTLREYGEY